MTEALKTRFKLSDVRAGIRFEKTALSFHNMVYVFAIRDRSN